MSAIPSFATNPEVDFVISVTGAPSGAFNSTFSQKGAATVNPEIFQYKDTSGILVANEFSITWDFTGDPFPSGTGVQNGARVGSVFTVENLLADVSGSPELNHLFFSILITMPLENVVPGSGFFGNGGMTLLVVQPNPAGHEDAISSSSGPVWNYIVNGTDEFNLYPHPFSFGATGGTDSISDNLGDTTSIDGTSPTTIGIRLDFDLTPGARGTFDGRWGFVPAPGAIAFFALAGLGLRKRRQRTK